MSLDVFLMVLAAAFLHAAWNAVVKSDGDRLAVIQLMSVTQLVISVCLVPFVTAPLAASWPYMAISAALNVGYMLFLNHAYRTGDLSLVYPLARGVAPLVVAAVSVVVLGEELSRSSRLAILLIGLGITSLAITRGASGLREPRAVLFALATSGFIAGYTIVDAFGARLAESAHGYMVWLTLCVAPLIIGSTQWLRKDRIAPMTVASRFAGVLSGGVSYVSSWLVMWALTLAPIAMVSALRETGIVFAVVIGVVFLKEKLNLARLASVAVTMVGTAMLRLNR